MLVLAHFTGAALGEEMGGPSPYPAAALTPVPVQPGFRLLQVGACLSSGLGFFREVQRVPKQQSCGMAPDGDPRHCPGSGEARVIYVHAVVISAPKQSGLTEEQIYNKCCHFQ